MLLTNEQGLPINQYLGSVAVIGERACSRSCGEASLQSQIHKRDDCAPASEYISAGDVDDAVRA